jgi:hypothetical protein
MILIVNYEDVIKFDDMKTAENALEHYYPDGKIVTSESLIDESVKAGTEELRRLALYKMFSLERKAVTFQHRNCQSCGHNTEKMYFVQKCRTRWLTLCDRCKDDYLWNPMQLLRTNKETPVKIGWFKNILRKVNFK